MVRGVFFDLDDTLIVNRPRQRAAFAVAWGEVFGTRVNLEPAVISQAFRSAYEDSFGYGTPGYAELAQISPEEIARRVSARVMPRFGLEEPVALDRFLHVWAREDRAGLASFPDTVDTLSALRDAGIKLGLITNGPSAIQRAKLAILALTDAFDTIVIDCEFGHPKPDCRIFAHAADTVGLSPAELLFVGDSLPADIAGARGAGWTAVWYNPGGAALPPDAEPPHYVIARLKELITLVPLSHVANARNAAGGPGAN